MKGHAKFGKLDADAVMNKIFVSRFNITGYPTIKVFDFGDGKTDAKATDYKSRRTVEDVVNFVSELALLTNVSPNIIEIYEQMIYKEECVESSIYCIIIIVPNILDSNAHERENYINILGHVAKKNRKQK